MHESDSRSLSEALKVRVFVDQSLASGRDVDLTPAQGHYLGHVMRLKEGGRFAVFNGRDGEWAARLVALGKCGARACLEQKCRPQVGTPDLWLLFAPVKRLRLDYLVQKATELGVARLVPVRTRRTVVKRVNLERLRANAIEAAEQSGRLTVPDVDAFRALDEVLREWEQSGTRRRLVYCDESGDGADLPWGGERGRAPAIRQALAGQARGPWAVLIGPEGGFDPAERNTLRALPYVVPVSLGPRIMRADTAAIAALAVWQSCLGDWSAPSSQEF